MITFLVVYKHNSSTSAFNNLTYICDGAPSLSEIQSKIIKSHNWSIKDFSIINIIPIKTELFEYDNN